MDKSDVKVHENHSDTASVITMKEYAPSEYPSSEPPPAYMKPRSNALRIAKLAAFTVIVSSIILGGFILAASWIQANTARNLDLTLNQELLDDLHPSYEHLVANEVLSEQHNAIDQAQPKNEASEENLASSDADKIVEKTIPQTNDEGLIPPPPPPPVPAKFDEKKVMDLDEIANILLQKNIKGNMNCIVEKRRNEELVDHAPMALNLPSANLPFGLNITTPPRLQHLTGEQMIVICKGDEDEEKEAANDDALTDSEKVDDLQTIVFPLPNNFLNQIQQVPQVIPLNNILQHIQLQQNPIRPLGFQHLPVQQLPPQHFQMQQLPVQQLPPQHFQLPQPQVQQIPVQQVPLQQVPLQQIQIQQIPVHPLPMQQQPVQQHPVPQIPINHINLPPFIPPSQQQPQQIIYPQQMPAEQPLRPPQQVLLPQNIFMPQPQMNNNQQNIPMPQEMIPFKEIGVDQNRIPFNHVLNNRVPINPMAVNDIPISRMQITHLPLRSEPQIKEEPVPVHHLLPPQAQQYQAENFRQEEPRFNEQPVPFFPPQNNQNSQLPVEVNDPGVLKAPAPLAQEPREQFAVPPPPPNHFFENNFLENREPEFVEENRAFRPLTVDVRPRGQRREPIANTLMPEISKIIPLNFERRPVDNGRKIRFPEIIESEEVRENRMPIITEITKIIPIRLEKEEPELRDSPILPLNPNVPPKNMDIPEIKLEKIPPRPFPIPINAILDMIFKGIRPLMGNRGHPFPIPIDIKIERIENKPLGFMGPPFLKKFEIIKKEESSLEEKSPNSQLEEEKNENENEENDDNEKEMVEAKVERVEVFDRENENGQAIPIPADAQDPQVYKLEEQEKQPEANEQSSFEDQAFLPNGQGRGARVFPIPQLFKEADIFSVFDAKPDKNAEPEVEIAEAPVESSINVANVDNERALEGANNRQGRVLNFPNPILNFFPIQGEKIMKPIIMKPEPLNFAPESRLLKLYPVSDAGMKNEEMKPQVADANMEETRPHFVQPRSV